MEERMLQRAQFLGKWTGVLFWMFIPNIVAGIMTFDSFQTTLPNVYMTGEILDLICQALYCAVLIRMGCESEHYKAAGIAGFIAVAGTIVSALMVSGKVIYSSGAVVIALIGASVSLVGEYQEYMGHAEVLEGIDSELSVKWKKLWTKFMILFLLLIGGMFIMFFTFTLGSIAMIVGTLGMVVIGIMKLVYLNKTSKVFKAYRFEPAE